MVDTAEGPQLLFPIVETCLNAQDFDYLAQKQAACLAAGRPGLTGDPEYIFRLELFRQNMIYQCQFQANEAGGLVQDSNCSDPEVTDVCPLLDTEREACGNCDSDANSTTLGESGEGGGDETGDALPGLPPSFPTEIE